jgi:hypothetical protein
MSATRVISVQERAYKTLAKATGELMALTNEVPSLSLTADVSISVMDTVLQRVLIVAQKDSEYLEALSDAVKKRDREKIMRLFLQAVNI